MKQPLLEKGKYYHIFNKGRQEENLFREDENYAHFLRLYGKYIDPIVETFVWVLLGNHFHLLIKATEKPLYQIFLICLMLIPNHLIKGMKDMVLYSLTLSSVLKLNQINILKI